MSPTSPGLSQPDIGVVIPSGGRGVRAGDGIPKQFRPIAGVPMLLRSIRAFTPIARVREIVVPLPEQFVETPPDWLTAILGERVTTVAGGETRTLSVSNGLRALSAESTIVLVHDAARPLVRRKTIDQIVERVSAGACAIAAAPVRDTLKRTNDRGAIEQTVSRDRLWQAHTPQGFPRDVLMDSYGVLSRFPDTVNVTDEASLVEQAGHEVSVVEDSTTNLKITTPEDFAIAEALMAL